VPRPAAVPGDQAHCIPVAQRQVAEGTRDQDGDLALGAAALGCRRHAATGVDREDHVLAPGLLVALDKGRAGAGRRLPVDVVDLVAGHVLAQIVEVQAATRRDGRVLALEQVRGTPVRVDEQA
jgi:hypothetical protein